MFFDFFVHYETRQDKTRQPFRGRGASAGAANGWYEFNQTNLEYGRLEMCTLKKVWRGMAGFIAPYPGPRLSRTGLLESEWIETGAVVV